MPKISEYDVDTVLDDLDIVVGVDAATGLTKVFTGSILRSGLATTAALGNHINDNANPHAVTKDQIGLGSVPNIDATDRAVHTGQQTAGTISDFADAADLRITIQKGTPGGVATLDAGGQLSLSQLPSISISDTFVVNSQASMLGLTAQVGDFAIRTDLNKTFVLSSNSPEILADWKEIETGNMAVALNVQLAATPDSIIAGTISRDSNGAATSAPVIWPDGTAGVYTADTLSSSFPGAVDAYHITYLGTPTVTYTQPLVTRDASGAVTVRPAMVVS